MSVTLDPELRRKIAAYCGWHQTTPSALVSAHFDAILRGFVVQQRAGGSEPTTLKVADPESA